VPSSVQSFIRYSPDVEQPEKDESETTKALIEALRSISERTELERWRTVLRSVRAKTHGILQGEIEVPQALPECRPNHSQAAAGLEFDPIGIGGRRDVFQPAARTGRPPPARLEHAGKENGL
jgi:hypothetical protein